MLRQHGAFRGGESTASMIKQAERFGIAVLRPFG
jgi:hypothetical protein